MILSLFLFHSHDVPSHLSSRNRYTEKSNVLRDYQYVLAIENAIEVDYVSEKLWNGLEAGAVPLYMGAPNVEEYAPRGSIVLIEEGILESDEKVSFERETRKFHFYIDPLSNL